MPYSHPHHSVLTALPFGWTSLPDGTHIFRPRTRTYDAATGTRVDVLDDSWLVIHPAIPEGEFKGIISWSQCAVLGDGSECRPLRTSVTCGYHLNLPGKPVQTIEDVLSSLYGLGSWPVPHLGTLWTEGVEDAPRLPTSA